MAHPPWARLVCFNGFQQTDGGCGRLHASGLLCDVRVLVSPGAWSENLGLTSPHQGPSSRRSLRWRAHASYSHRMAFAHLADGVDLEMAAWSPSAPFGVACTHSSKQGQLTEQLVTRYLSWH